MSAIRKNEDLLTPEEYIAGELRREKLLAYQGIPSLHTYILAEQEQREITVWRRQPQGWEKTILTGAETLHVPELEFGITLDAIYARTGL